MKPEFKKVLILTLAPLVVLALTLVADSILALVIALLAPVLYLFAGLILLFTKEKKWGQLLLLSAGIIMLIGLSVCTVAAYL